jgi:hypothetical protein
VRCKPTVSWVQVMVCAGIAIVASGATLLSSIGPAVSFCAHSPEADAIGASIEQRLQGTLDEARHPGVDFRLDLGQRQRPHVADTAGAISGAPAEGDLTDPERTTRASTAKLGWLVNCPAA